MGNGSMLDTSLTSWMIKTQNPWMRHDLQNRALCGKSVSKSSTLHFVQLEGKLCSDQMGRCESPSARGVNYILVAYFYNPNPILVEPIPNHKETSTQTVD
jgi:hypothetical protein